MITLYNTCIVYTHNNYTHVSYMSLSVLPAFVSHVGPTSPGLQYVDFLLTWEWEECNSFQV